MGVFISHIVGGFTALGCEGAWTENLNEEFLSLSGTKVLQGFFALCILLHHTAQKTAASWIGLMYYRKGLDFFRPHRIFVCRSFPVLFRVWSL